MASGKNSHIHQESVAQPILRVKLNPSKLFKNALLANVKELIERKDEGELCNSLSISWTTCSCISTSIKGLSVGQEASNVLQKAAAEEIVDLFVSTSAFSLTLKCHWYSGVALWETIKKEDSPKPNLWPVRQVLCPRKTALSTSTH